MNADRSSSTSVAIIGGGPAGAAVAITLARFGVRCMVLEAAAQPGFKVGECLPPTAGPVIDQLGLTEFMRRGGHLPSYGNRSVWGSPVAIERDFLFSPYGCGWHLDRLLFEAQLADQARTHGVDWQSGVRVINVSREENQWVLDAMLLQDRVRLRSAFLVDATGRPGRFARQIGARQLRFDQLIGLWNRLEPNEAGADPDTRTLVESVRSGWWYSSGLPDGSLMVIYFTDRDLIGLSGAGAGSDWEKLLNETDHTRRRVKGSSRGFFANPRVLPANNARLDRFGGEGWLAVGDAAVAYDPLSSYGITASLAGGIRAGEAIANFLNNHPRVLQEYAGHIEAAFLEYLKVRSDHYLLEQRWPDEPFWRRRAVG
jgi:flavin-dependent dehydrogenase